MPNRIVREGIITSETVNSLNWAEEVFYRRLHSVVDDFGRYHANHSLLRAACYPLLLDKVADSDIGKWLTACVNAGLVRVYTIDSKRFLEVQKFGQQVRAKQSKYPQPPPICVSDATHTPSTCTAHAHLGVVGVGDEGEKDNIGLKPDANRQAREVLNFLNSKTGKHYEPVAANLELITARLRDGATAEDLRAVVAKKCREWLGDEKMSQYLRPATLFNRTKFAQYQGELGAQEPQQKVAMP